MLLRGREISFRSCGRHYPDRRTLPFALTISSLSKSFIGFSRVGFQLSALVFGSYDD
jgi:hypothetical protein